VQVGLIGLGQVGAAVASGILAGEAGDAQLIGALVRDPGRVPEALRDSITVTHSVEDFLALPTALVIELGGHDALREHGVRVLEAGKDLMTISVGALADPSLHEALREAAARGGRRMLIPSGAIAGLDAIGAAALGDLREVTHTTRKPVAAFTAEQLDGPVPSEPKLLFDGPAQEGVLRFPENVNVAAAVSLAGIGLARTRLRVFADPTVERNRHEVVVEGDFGRLRIEIENQPTSNPKTGRIVSLSVLKAIRSLTAPIVIGV
jgi:aspartate dehydrogenase